MKSTDSELPPQLYEGLVLLASYLLSCGRGLAEEPAGYGTFRCADSARRVLDLLAENGARDFRLSAVHRALDDLASAPQNSSDVSEELDTLCGQMARIVKDSFPVEP
ncbi:DUF6092 family protein [Streptomyces iconiensis]|uniref:DUF6092 family protein n=1 Tax=Streptomyces iconiensis TaxID=1384038 RepID=A0ABT7A328_9ACTN|nr:DUF6092 family protein [Streptomyces iconiensis]MDJ1135474.1 DUF6092 family protein [Streptomyces iconiensis]